MYRIRETQAIRKREEELSRPYGIHSTTWAEDWPVYRQLKTEKSMYWEKFQNRFLIMETFKFGLVLFLSGILWGIIALINKNLFIFLIGFSVCLIAVGLWWYIYYHLYCIKKISILETLISPFYIKYDEHTLKTYLNDYRPKKNKPEILPPRPPSPFESEDFFKEIEKPKKEFVVETPEEKETEEKVEAVEMEAKAHEETEKQAVSGINLHLVGTDVIDSDNHIGSDTTGDEGAQEEVLRSTGEPEPSVQESPEIRADDGQSQLPEESNNLIICCEAKKTEDIVLQPEEDVVDEEEVDLIFSDYREDPEDDIIASSQWMKFYESLDDALTETEPEELPAKTLEEDPEEEEVPVEEEEPEEFDSEEEEVPVEEGSVRESLFPEGYLPTVAELLAATKRLRNS